ncbi:histone deacetylase domain-containing protein [Xylariales sp. AK1849]|nr:histone deacetylase domain-containing protein [Xylariales sp. AK1849]
MAAPGASPSRRLDDVENTSSSRSNAGNGTDAGDADLLRSLNQLSLSSSTSNSRSPSRASSISPKPPVHTLPALDRLTLGSPSPRTPSKSPVARSVSNGNARNQSRSATPTLLRKASMNSLHSMNGFTPNRAPSRRSSSAQLLSPTVTTTRSPANGSTQHMTYEAQKPQQTQASVASAHFKAELELLHGKSSSEPCETAVFLHDQCYGHRFERSNSTRSNLENTVERPERLQAVALGVALAYVRLGGRHHDGKVQIHPDLDITSLSPPFRIIKSDVTMSLTDPAVTNVHGTKWMEELRMMCEAAGYNVDNGILEIQRPKMDRGSGLEPEKLHQGDLYLCQQSLAAFEASSGAMAQAVDDVCGPSPTKRAFVGVRPPGHHCSVDYPHGFCWLNNVHVGISHGFLKHGLTHAAILDIDLHHGDGSQDIARTHNARRHEAEKTKTSWKKAPEWQRTSIGYFSLHDINSYPCENGDQNNIMSASMCIEDAHGQNIWNVHLEEWKTDVEFWSLYQTKYLILLDKTRSYLRREAKKCLDAGVVPKAVIFVSAGFDASEHEGAGMQRHTVNVPTDFYARITRDVVKLASEEGLAVGGRVISCLEGGYSDRALTSGVCSHLSGLAGTEVRRKEDTVNGSSRELEQRISLAASPLSRRSTLSSSDSDVKSKTPGFPYDPSWWTPQELDRLDSGDVSPPEYQARQNVTAPTYSSPTQASTAKVVAPAKGRRSMSGLASASIGPQPTITRVPTPPPPDVYWPTATLELSRLLKPSNIERDASSKTWEEIRKAKDKIKARQSTTPRDLTTESSASSARMNLRERKPPKYSSTVEDPQKDRRRTVAGDAVLASEKASARSTTASAAVKQPRQTSRRLSTASTMSTATSIPAQGSFPVDSGIPRPGGSQTMRPDSSMSVRTQATAPEDLAIRKSRGPAIRTGRLPTAKSKNGKKGIYPPGTMDGVKKETIPSLASARSRVSTSPARQAAVDKVGPGQSSREPSMAPSTVNCESGSERGKVTNGAKKIKINLLTKEKKEAMKKEAEERVRKEKTLTPGPEFSKPLPQITPQIQDPKDAYDTPHPTPGNDHPIMPSIEASEIPELPQDQDVMQWIPSPVRSQSPVGPTSTDATSPPLFSIHPPEQVAPRMEDYIDDSLIDPTLEGPPPVFTPQRPQNSSSDIFVPYQPEGSTPQAIQRSAPVKWLPANMVETPAAFRGGHHFTSTSAIPFAGGPGGTPAPWKAKTNNYKMGGTDRGTSEDTIEQNDEDMSDVAIPETPEHRL